MGGGLCMLKIMALHFRGFTQKYRFCFLKGPSLVLWENQAKPWTDSQ